MSSSATVIREVQRLLRRSLPGRPMPVFPMEDSRAELVLLAEDDPVATRVIEQMLGRIGLKVIHRADGVSALELARNSQPNAFGVVLLDLHLPRIDGFELLRQLRALPAFAKTPILVITGSGAERHIVQTLEHGASDYLVKPFSPDVLMARIRKAIRTRS